MSVYMKNSTNYRDAFVDDGKQEFTIMIIPLDGSDVVPFTIHDKLYFVHVVNSYEFDSHPSFVNFVIYQ